MYLTKQLTAQLSETREINRPIMSDDILKNFYNKSKDTDHKK